MFSQQITWDCTKKTNLTTKSNTFWTSVTTGHITALVPAAAMQSDMTISVQLLKYADNVALPAFVCCMLLLLSMQQSINISCPLGPQQQTCSRGFAAMGPCWYRLTARRADRDKWIDTTPLHKQVAEWLAHLTAV